MAKNCPINKDEAVLRATPVFQNILTKYKKTNLSRPDLISLVYRKLGELADPNARFDISNLFLDYLNKINEEEAFIDYAQGQESGFIDIPKGFNIEADFGEDIQNFNDIITGQDANQGSADFADVSEHSTPKHIRDAGESYFKELVVGSLGNIDMSRKDYYNIVEKARTSGLNEFIDFLLKKYPGFEAQETSEDALMHSIFGNNLDKIKNKKLQNNMIQFHTRMQKTNNLPVNKPGGKKRLMRHNAIFDKKTGEVKGTGGYGFSLTQSINPITRKKNPDFEPGDFVHTSDVLLGGIEGKKLGNFTYSLAGDSIIRYRFGRKKGTVFAQDVTNSLTVEDINNMLIELMNTSKVLPLTLVGAKPGDATSFYASPIFQEYFDILMPEDDLVNVIDALDNEMLLELADKHNYKIWPLIKDIQSRIQGEVQKTSHTGGVKKYKVIEFNSETQTNLSTKYFATEKEAEAYAKAQNDKVKPVEVPSKTGKSSQIKKIVRFTASSLTRKEINDARLARRERTLPKAIKGYNEFMKLVNQYASLNFEKWIESELNDFKNINEENAKDLRDSMNPDHVPSYQQKEGNKVVKMPLIVHLGSLIARHNWYKAVRYNGYAKDGSIINLFNRTRMNMSQGLVVNDSPTQVVVIDANKIYFKYDGKRKEHMIDLKGIDEKRYIGDGAQMADSSYVLDTVENSGRSPSNNSQVSAKQIKTAEVQRSDDGESYIEIKSETFVATPGIAIYDKLTNQLIVRADLQDGDVIITNNKGARVNRVVTLDEAKTLSGEYALEGDSHKQIELKPESSRVIILPESKAHHNGTSPLQWAGHFMVDNPMYAPLRKVFGDHVLELANEWLNLLNLMHIDPAAFRKEMEHRWNLSGDFIDSLQSSMDYSEGNGVFHPDRLQVTTQSLMNSFIVQGVLKGRNMTTEAVEKYGSPKRASSLVKFKPDWGRRIQDREKAFIIGADNATLYEYAWKNFVTSSTLINITSNEINRITNDIRNDSFRYSALSDVGKQWYDNLSPADVNSIKGIGNKVFIRRKKYFDRNEIERLEGLNKTEQVEALNIWLKDNELLAMVGRNPMLNVNGVIIRRLKEVDVNGGNDILLTPNDVFGPLTADSDGDTATVFFAGTKVMSDLRSALKPVLDKYGDVFADVGMIKNTRNTSILDSNNFVDTLSSLARGKGSQGTITNYVNLRNNLSFKYKDITLRDKETGETITLIPIKPNDIITNEYYEMKEDYDRSKLPSFAKFIEKDGKLRLQTEAHHADLILANSAVDHPKHHFLSQTDYDGTYSWYFPYLFKTEDGAPIPEWATSALNRIVKMDNAISKLRMGYDVDRNKVSMERWYNDSARVLNMLNLSSSELVEALNSKKSNVEFIDIAYNNTESSLAKKLIEAPHLALDKLESKIGYRPKYPMHHTPQFFWNSHVQALKSIQAISMEYKERSNKGWDAGNVMAEEIMEGHYKNFENGNKNKKATEESNSIKAFDYNEDIFNFTKNTLMKIAKQLDGKSQDYVEAYLASVTWNIFKGNTTSKVRNILPSHKFFNKKIYSKFMKNYDKWMSKRNEDGTYVLSNTQYEGNKSGLYQELDNPNNTPNDMCLK